MCVLHELCIVSVEESVANEGMELGTVASSVPSRLAESVL